MSDDLSNAIRTAVIELFLAGDRDFPLEASMNLVESGICDSMGLVELAAALEARFPGLRIDDQDINRENLGSITAIKDFLDQAGIRA